MYINIAKINFKPEGGTSGPRPESITLELNIPSTNLDQEFNIEEGYDGYAPVIADPYDVDELFDDVVNVNGDGHAIPDINPGSIQYDGSVDEEGLKSIGWDDDDIAALKANVWWYDWQNEDYKADKGIWGNKKQDSIANLYKDNTTIIGVCIPTNNTPSTASYAFNNCSNLVFVPKFNTSNVTSMTNMFSHCSSLKSIPHLDTSNVTSMDSTFNYCSKLTSIPQLDTSKVTNMSSMFSHCSSLKSIPQLDTSKVTNMSSMFSWCSSLTTIEGIDFSSAVPTSSIFSTVPNLTRINVNGSMNRSFSGAGGFTALTNIDYESVKSFLEAANRTTTTTAKTLALSRTMDDPDGELAALVASCATKGWTITGLTLS